MFLFTLFRILLDDVQRRLLRLLLGRWADLQVHSRSEMTNSRAGRGGVAPEHPAPRVITS